MFRLFKVVSVAILFAGLASGFPGGRNPVPFEWLRESDAWDSNDLSSISPLETYSDCGGVITLNASQDLTLVEYAPTGGIPAKLRCVWPIHTNHSNIEVFYDYFRLPAGAGLSFYNFNASSDIAFNIHKVQPLDQSQYRFAFFDKAYLVLTSYILAGGEGFRLGLRASTATSGTAGFNIHHGNASGGLRSHASGQYENSERSSIVIQPPTNCSTTVKITTLDTGAQSDLLSVYTMKPYEELADGFNSLSPAGRYSGYHPFGPANSTTTSVEPRILTFRSDNTGTASGFTLEWTCSQNDE